MKSITLSRGKVALVDDADYEWLNQYKWCFHESYARRYGPRPGRQLFLMHREITKAPAGMMVDHINGDGLDNRRCNLRICSTKENSRNRKKPTDNTSGYKGVFWVKRKKKWQVFIGVNRKTIHVGYFKDIKEAARAYDEAAKKYFGEFARTNE